MSSSFEFKELVNKMMKMGDRLHLNREQAQSQLEKIILPGFIKDAEKDESVKQNSMLMMIDILKIMFNSTRWEDRFGAINGSVLLAKFYYEPETKDPAIKYFFWNNIRSEQINKLMVDEEFRVRNQLGELLREMILADQQKGIQHFSSLLEILLVNIEETFTREPEGGTDASGSLANKKIIAYEESGNKTMHDTQGWKSLETSMRIMQNIIEAIGTHLYEFQLDRILNCILQGVDHINRFVREISYFVIKAIFIASKTIFEAPKDIEDQDENKMKQHEKNVQNFNVFCEKLVPIVAQGLSDNWSQVRYASSQAVRGLYYIIKDKQDLRDKYDPLLVPRMCLNRYYVAEGVKLYSIDTWKEVHGENGKNIVCKYAEEVCKFYILQSEADNHAVREAACHCISELCTKVAQEVDKEPFKPFVAKMLNALLDCFKDQSWPVRDCACVACGHFVSTFPEECKEVFPELKQLWFDHLSDNIQSVREHSSQSIIEVLKNAEMYSTELQESIEKHVSENLMLAKTQRNDSSKFSGLENETVFGVAKEKVPVDDHTNNQLYSCGSLAPKLKRGGGCMDHGFTKPKEQWEMSDGAIFLLRECSRVESMHPLVIKNLEKLSDLAYIDTFKHSSTLRENLFHSLAKILTQMGKKKFRAYVELFLDPTFRVAQSMDPQHQNLAYSAQDLLVECDKTYGENIFKAIVQGHDERYVSELQRVKEEAKRFASQQHDFIYPVASFQPANNFGKGSGQGAVAGMLNPGGVGGPDDVIMTKAPWAK